MWLLDEELDEPYLAAVQNLQPGLAGNPERMAGWCYCLETFQEGDLTGAANINVVTCFESQARWGGNLEGKSRYQVWRPRKEHYGY